MVARAGAQAVSKSSVTIPRVVTTGPRAVSRRGLVRLALGCPRQFESVAGGRPPGGGAGADLHGGPGWFRVVPGLPLAGLQRLQ